MSEAPQGGPSTASPAEQGAFAVELPGAWNRP
jgi:hypothetical protein